MSKASAHITLDLHDLTIGYISGKNHYPIIENINIKAQKGQLICFMGPNGVGKSTLLRTICKLQPALSGNILINSKALRDISASNLAKQISLVLTDRINAGNLSAYELVALGRYPYLGWNVKPDAQDQQQVERAINQAGIQDLIDKKVYALSDGQLQKVMIARALAQDTPIMILDEPTAHLDLNNRVAVVNLLKKLAQDTQKTIIMATHELDLALQTADRLWLAGSQQPIQEGIPEDLVLNGIIDNVFQLKGYDLKTGQLEKTSLGYKISIEGEGHNYLWTKNALERNGFEIDNKAEFTVQIKEKPLTWMINKKGTEYRTLEHLISDLLQLY